MCFLKKKNVSLDQIKKEALVTLKVFSQHYDETF